MRLAKNVKLDDVFKLCALCILFAIFAAKSDPSMIIKQVEVVDDQQMPVMK